MANSWCRRMMTTLAAGAALGLLLPVAPAQAQQYASLKAVWAGQSRSVSCCELEGHTIYLLFDNGGAQPGGFIIAAPRTATPQKGDMEAWGKRFESAFKLRGYTITEAQDGTAVFLFRQENAPTSTRDLLVTATRLGPLAQRFNSLMGGAPCKLEGSTLVWEAEVAAGDNRRTLELRLNLLQGKSFCVDVRLRNIGTNAVLKILSQQLKLTLKPVMGEQQAELRKYTGVKPLGFALRYEGKKGNNPAAKNPSGVVLSRASGESGSYRLASTHALAAQRGKAPRLALPELPQVSWPGGGGSRAEAAPAPKPANPRPTAPATGGGEGLDEDLDPNAPLNDGAASTPHEDAPALHPAPSPASAARAREEYARRLKEL